VDGDGCVGEKDVDEDEAGDEEHMVVESWEIGVGRQEEILSGEPSKS
jgi:hypothetical protein